MADLTDISAINRLGSVINLLFGYDGRIGRLHYWLGLMATWAVPAFFASIAEKVVAGTGDIGRYVAFLVIVGTLCWMHSAVSVKRLHDLDKSAGWYLLYGVAPPALFAAAIHFYTEGVFILAWALFASSIAGLLWVLIELGLRRGTDGPNCYGPPT
jgi:uncharacterized membrane protein YhaH (DUF805 family)